MNKGHLFFLTELTDGSATFATNCERRRLFKWHQLDVHGGPYDDGRTILDRHRKTML